jgi:hypothetical protein
MGWRLRFMVGLNQSLRANASVESDAGHNGTVAATDWVERKAPVDLWRGAAKSVTGQSPLPKIRASIES